MALAVAGAIALWVAGLLSSLSIPAAILLGAFVIAVAIATAKNK